MEVYNENLPSNRQLGFRDAKCAQLLSCAVAHWPGRMEVYNENLPPNRRLGFRDAKCAPITFMRSGALAEAHGGYYDYRPNMEFYQDKSGKPQADWIDLYTAIHSIMLYQTQPGNKPSTFCKPASCK